jgi:hypothetical protein
MSAEFVPEGFEHAPSAVAEVVLKAATADRPKLRYPVGSVGLLRALRRYAPAALVDAAVRRTLRLDAPTLSLPITAA